MAFSLDQYGWDNMLMFIVVIKTPSFKLLTILNLKHNVIKLNTF